MARGDDEFVEFARSASSRLMRAAYLMTGNHHQSEDAVQTVLVRVYASWSRIRNNDSYGYARTVLFNHLADKWRRPIREYASEEVPEQQQRGDIAVQVADRRWLLSLLGRLTTRERAIVVMRYYFDLSEAQVADELKLSPGTVKSTSSRALEKLRTVANAARIPAIDEESW
jgi:RNA polymerase sigma-70 factor (sigma-E family)